MVSKGIQYFSIKDEALNIYILISIVFQAVSTDGEVKEFETRDKG